ncbi:hypothetical protein OSTOST_03045, partial [Ostertagia ostertagi]
MVVEECGLEMGMDSIWLTSFIIHFVSNTFGVSANILLVYLVLKKTPNQLVTYSILILNFAICDLVACTAALFVHP